MKRVLFFFATVVITVTSLANPIEKEKAVLVARSFLARYVEGAGRLPASVVYTHPMPQCGQPAMYAVNVGNAFVLVAADDIARPVIGYNLSRPWPSNESQRSAMNSDKLPSQVTGYLDDLAAQIEAKALQSKASEMQRDGEEYAGFDRLVVDEWHQLINDNRPLTTSTNLPDSVGPLLSTTWGQGQYYNALCPVDNAGPSGHALTGCVATSMAQIVNYWGYPLHGRGSHSYQTNYGVQSVNYGTATYDYANMPSALTASSTSAQVNAVATLMYHCGVATNMFYGSSESGAYDQDARAGLIDFFRMNPNASFVEKIYFTDDEWNDMLRQELADSIVVMYGGQGTGGHSFVCDGYKSNDYFHFNFGWNGNADGWYLTSAVNPAGMNFNTDQSAIIGIVPDSSGNVIIGQTFGTSTFTVDEPLEFYHLMGHNSFEGTNYNNTCGSNVWFISANASNVMVTDIMEFEDQNISIYNCNGVLLRALSAGGNNDVSPVVSNSDSLSICFYGNMYYAGFKLNISQAGGCRMVSNIVSAVDTTTVHLTWAENGNATQWQIEYGVTGFAQGTGLMDTVTINAATFNDLSVFTEYDFYIRPVCGDGQYGQWNMVTVLVEASYWQDVVTSQPAGYVLNTANNMVEISTPQALAWWARNGCSINACLTADIDLSGYKWRPTYLHRDFYGQGHVISNAYICETTYDVALFSDCSPDLIVENLGLANFYVKSPSFRVASMFGTFRGIMRNCYVTGSFVDGTDQTAGMIAENAYGSVINCFVNANVIGNRWTGLMIGSSEHGTIHNCYAAGSVRHRSYCYIAGVAATTSAGEISNCYSVETEMGVVGYLGTTLISDTSTFVRSASGCTLLSPVVFDGLAQTDLLTVLNLGVSSINDSIYFTWIADTGNVNGGYPVLGGRYDVQCANVSDPLVRNIQVGDSMAVAVSWTEDGDSGELLLRYRRHDLLTSAYTYVTLTNNPDTIYGIPLGYSYDFGIRKICDSTSQSGWVSLNNVEVDLLYWTDVVTTQPDGYVVDNEGNVEIYSVEALAWLSAVTHGFHHQQQNSFVGKTVTLKADINLAGYRWYAIGNDRDWDGINVTFRGGFSGTFDGENHTISNMYVSGGASGLFNLLQYGSVRNVVVNGGNGKLICVLIDGYEVSNCHISATVYGGGGALCGQVLNYGYGPTRIVISNCSSSGTVYGRESCGSLIGEASAYYGDVEVKNCFATGNVYIIPGGERAWYRGGLIGYIRGAHVDNCYSTGYVEIDNTYCYGKVIGALDLNPHVHYLYGRDDVNEGWDLLGYPISDASNISQFHHNGNTNLLTPPVNIGGTNYADLLAALNAWVVMQNDSTLRSWRLDDVTGYPVFGNFYVPSCGNPMDFSVTQASVVGDVSVKTRLEWTQNDEPDHWEVRYLPSGHNVNTATVVPVYSNPCVLVGLPIGSPMDFYVRAVCGEGDTSNWCGPVEYLPEKLRWTDVVTSQPEGFQEDGNGNVYISSAEGLSWLSSVSNELNGAQSGQISNVVLTSDIDLSAYRWTSIGNKDWWHRFNATFNGNNHVVYGLYCNELSGYQGLFGQMDGTVKNLILSNCDVNGTEELSANGTRTNGAIAGYAMGNKIYNCIVTGIVTGGGLVGTHICYEWNINNIENSCFIGNARAGGNPVGICDHSLGGGAIHNCYVVNTDANVVVDRYYVGVSSNTDFSGNGTTWTLNTPENIGGSFYSDLVETLNAWVDLHNANGQYLHWSTDSSLFNGGYPVLESVYYPVITMQDTVTSRGYYSWHGMVFTSDTVVTDTLTASNGGDSIVTHHIIVTSAPVSITIVDACSSYTWNGETYHTSGDYVHLFPSVSGVDSVAVLYLTITPKTSVDAHTVCGNSFTWIDGVTYLADNNTATYTLQTDDGCDSVVHLLLYVNGNTVVDTFVSGCDSITWEGITYTTNQILTSQSTTTSGCDSVATIHLVVNHSVERTVAVTASGSYTWHDQTYTESGDYTWQGFTTKGCDSTVTLHLTITPVDIETVDPDEMKVQVCPNPTTGWITIDADDVLSVEVIEPVGRRLLSFENSNRLNLGVLPPGSYILKIQLQRGLIVRRVILKP